MFTGIVAGVGRILEVERLSVDGGVRLTVDARDVPAFAADVGDSVAIAGACMTAIRVDDGVFAVDTSRESLERTSGLDAPGEVNIETSVRVGDPLGGHLVAGHVDGVGEVMSMTQAHESWQLIVRAPAELSKYFAYKGSVAIDGVSLTVNRVMDSPQGCEFSVNVIPHTHRVTTLRSLRAGSRVNIEVDLIARYVERMLSLKSGETAKITPARPRLAVPDVVANARHSAAMSVFAPSLARRCGPLRCDLTVSLDWNRLNCAAQSRTKRRRHAVSRPEPF